MRSADRKLRKQLRSFVLRSAASGTSAVEHYLDMVGVTGSIPVARTILPIKFYRRRDRQAQPLFFSAPKLA